jgi:hypothetical protein
MDRKRQRRFHRSFHLLESDGRLISLFGGNATLPILSTDSARLAVLSSTNSNDLEWFFSDTYFSIRPDPGLGLQAPVVHLSSPTPGSTFAGGSVVPITWTASAQQGLRSFDIQVSTDGGETFHLITTDLRANARSFNWQLPGVPALLMSACVISSETSCSRTALTEPHRVSITP